MLLRTKKTYISLKEAADSCRIKESGDTFKQVSFTGNVLAVVVDATRPLYRDRDKDYIVEVKVVDPSINQSRLFGVLVRYCSIYLFSKHKEELEVVTAVGQILLLHQFSFMVWNDIKLEARYLGTIERMYVIKVQGRQPIILENLQNSCVPLEIQQQLSAQCQQLYRWFHQEYYFKQMTPQLGLNLINSYCVLADPFSIILHRLPSTTSKKLILEDSNNNRFFLELESLGIKLPKEQYLLLRGVKFVGNFFELNLTQTGNILGLPQQISEKYGAVMNYCAVSRFNQRFLMRERKACQLSKLTYVASRTTPLMELLTALESYDNRRNFRQESTVAEYYMVEAVAVNFTGKLRLYHTEHQIPLHPEYLKELSGDENKEIIQQGKLAYLYEGILGIIDRSSECTGRLLYVHLFNNEPRTLFHDPSIIQELNKQAGCCSGDFETQVQAKIEAILQNLIDKSNFTNTISMVLEPIKSDILLYRLTNTCFL